MRTEVETLTRKFSGLADEELLRIITTEREVYRKAARDAAAKELMRRGVSLPRTALEEMPAQAESQSNAQLSQVRADGTGSPYQLVDLFFDATIFAALLWFTKTFEDVDLVPQIWFLSSIINGLLIGAVWLSVLYLRDKWRKKVW